MIITRMMIIEPARKKFNDIARSGRDFWDQHYDACRADHDRGTAREIVEPKQTDCHEATSRGGQQEGGQ